MTFSDILNVFKGGVGCRGSRGNIFLCLYIYLSMNYEKNLKTIISYLPFKLRNALQSVKLPDDITEIRMISGRPVIICTASKRLYITDSFKLSEKAEGKLLAVSKNDINDTFNSICNFSVYARRDEITNGFITLPGGNRAGICGTAVNRDGSVYNIRDISSVNIRIAREVKGCGEGIVKRLSPAESFLICGAPGSGKTTLLRDVARLLSYDYRVSLIDTRLELACAFGGENELDAGFCDVFSGYLKLDGFSHAVRCMSPEYIVCDELSADDISSVITAQKSGVKVIASAHCVGRDELLSNPLLKPLVKSRVFSAYVFLDSGKTAGNVREIVYGNDLYG